MKILVYDIAASSRGALSILMDFYHQVQFYGENHEWHFVISTPQLKQMQHISVHRYPWVKSNPLFRIYFDNFVVPKLANKLNVDCILSLQNVCVSHCKKPQMISLHNALPFFKCDHTVLSGTLSIIKQQYLNRKVLSSLRKAKKVFVPNEWIFNSCVKINGVRKENVLLVKPIMKLQDVDERYTGLDADSIEFFYPANAEPYKRHDVLIKACEYLKGYNFRLLFTAKGIENRYIRELKKKTASLDAQIDFYGDMPREDVYTEYCRSVLLFPSEIETDALPILEAMKCNCYIIAARTDFASCILRDYPNCDLVPVGDVKGFAESMKMVLERKRMVAPVVDKNRVNEEMNGDLVKAVIEG